MTNESQRAEHESAGQTVRSRPWQADMKEIAPEAYKRMMAMYERENWPGLLPPTLLHLLWIAVDAVPTHLYVQGIELHARMAFQHGASVEQVVEALEIAASVCERSLVNALPAVLEAAGEAGRPIPSVDMPLSEEQLLLRNQYVAREGAWNPGLDAVLRVAPQFLRGEFEMCHGAPLLRGLDPKWRAMIALAVQSCPAVLDVLAVKWHTKRCLALGVTIEEVVETVLSSSGISIHAYSLGIPAVKRAIADTRLKDAHKTGLPLER